jgi:hypothetical protein
LENLLNASNIDVFLLQAWNDIYLEYNSSQTDGEKSLIELKTKYKNAKADAKKTLSKNAKEMKMTGGGTAELLTENPFNFSGQQIEGLKNPYDSDWQANDGADPENGEIVEVFYEEDVKTPKSMITVRKSLKLHS